MSATKYRVSQDDVYYGNYPAKDATAAVLKAYDRTNGYYPFDFSRPFNIKRGSYVGTVTVEAPDAR